MATADTAAAGSPVGALLRHWRRVRRLSQLRSPGRSRERNQLLLAAGYAPLYREAGLADTEAAQVRAAVERILEHEPYPAVVMDRHWTS